VAVGTDPAGEGDFLGLLFGDGSDSSGPAQLVYGDEVGGAIVPEEEGDFLTQLARDVLEGAKLSDLQTLFADDLQVSHNPMGSLTTPSAVIVPGTKVMTWDDWVTQKTVIVRRTRKKEVVPEGQMGLGI